ncbi:hypothetical protein FJZ31_12830 [Candidatus Poribacteria bacterium]|nr:hypothetical protein [Candidatus Poribacteria bacterium]
MQAKDSHLGQIVHLIIVPGHAIYIGSDRSQVYFSGENNWVGTYVGYRYEDEVLLYIDHIRCGIIEANEDSSSFLVFSGGYTRKPELFPQGVKPISEAKGYWNIAEQCGWFNCDSVKERTKTEEYARDSYENILFSWCLFRNTTGTEPRKVTVCGLTFKKQRYEYHADVIRRDLKVQSFRFCYIGVNNPPDYVLDGGSRLGEAETKRAFEQDPHGEGEFLKGKRLGRDYLGKGCPYLAPGKREEKRIIAEQKHAPDKK